MARLRYATGRVLGRVFILVPAMAAGLLLTDRLVPRGSPASPINFPLKNW